MKKSLAILTLVAVSLALVGTACATGPICPPGCKLNYVGPKYVPTTWPKLIKPKVEKWKGPMTLCGPCGPVCCPGEPYADVATIVPKKETVTSDVKRDLCVGSASGKCNLCGPCSPVISWSGNWKTSIVVGKVTTSVITGVGLGVTPSKVSAVPEPCKPPSCDFTY